MLQKSEEETTLENLYWRIEGLNLFAYFCDERRAKCASFVLNTARGRNGIFK